MSGKLELHDIDALRRLGSALRTFKKATLTNIGDAQRNISQDMAWIQERIVTFQNEVKQAKREVDQAEKALSTCQKSGTGDRGGRDRPPNCSAEERALDKAKDNLKRWELKLALAKKLKAEIDREIETYNRVNQRLSRLATDDMDKALGEVGRLIGAYENVHGGTLSQRYTGPIPTTTGFDYNHVSAEDKATEGTHGSLYRKARKEFFLLSLKDPNVSTLIKNWIVQEIRRVGPHGNWRNPPNFDVGHGMNPDDTKKRIDNPATFHWEESSMNRSHGTREKEYKAAKNGQNCSGTVD